MKKLFIILFSLFSIWGYSQEGPINPSRVKGEGYFLRDAEGRIITTESRGVLSILWAEDTATNVLVLPPDTFQVFNITMVNAGESSTLAEGVQAYWSLEETSGATAFDSANSYDGTLINTPTQSQTGISNLCYDFDAGSSEYIDFGTDVLDAGTDDLSVAGWINPSSLDISRGIIGSYGTYPYYYLRLRMTDNRFAGTVNFTGGLYQVLSDNPIPINTWTHFAYRLDRDGNETLHINNVQQSSTHNISAHSAVNLTNSNDHAVGRIGDARGGDYSPYFFDGRIDEVSVYDRLIITEEISNLYWTGIGKFWPYGVTGGDTINMTLEGVDGRLSGIDSVIVNWKYTGWPTSRFDGTEQFAFELNDLADYADTNFLWNGRGDTTVYYSAWTKLFTGETTPIGNRDTIFIDSSDIVPPIPDPSGWDIYLDHDFEGNSAPSYWSLSAFQADITNSVGRYGNQWYRAEELRSPTWWDVNVDDSIVVDSEIGSKVLKTMWRGGTHAGYVGNSFRGGEYWKEGFPGSTKYKELYTSINIKLKQDFFDNVACGGKIAPGFNGGSPGWTVEDPPDYGEGFWFAISWGHENSPVNREGALFFYIYYQGSQVPYGASLPWDAFQPTGGGIDAGDYNANDEWIWPDDSEEWVNITVRCVVNSFTGSSPNYDGILEGYINGRLVGQYTDLYLITYPDEQAGNYIDYHQFYQSWGGSCGPDVDKWSFNDDIVVFTYDVEVDVPRGNEPSPPGRILNLPNWPKTE